MKILRETEKVDVVIALSHGGVEKGPDGRYVAGEDVQLAKDVPGIDVVISGHSHTELSEAIVVNGRTPVVQTGKESNNLGELVIAVDGDKLTVTSYRLLPIDDSIAGDRRTSSSSRNRSAPPRSRRVATASTSRWPLPRATCPTRTPTSPPARCWPISSPIPSAPPPVPTSGSPPTA